MKRLVVAALLAPLVLVPSPGRADEPARTQASWNGLRVPHLVVGEAGPYRPPFVKIRFRGTQADYPYESGILAMAATADSALVMRWEHGKGEREEFEGSLLEIRADGSVEQVERRALGIPIADPLGHVAFWTNRDERRVRQFAYDTASGTKIRGPLLRKGARVHAVEGSTAYLFGSGVEDPGGGLASRWTPGDATTTALPLPPPSDPDGGRMVLDVDRGRVLSMDFDDGPTLISDLEGNVIRAVRTPFGPHPVRTVQPRRPLPRGAAQPRRSPPRPRHRRLREAPGVGQLAGHERPLEPGRATRRASTPASALPRQHRAGAKVRLHAAVRPVRAPAGTLVLLDRALPAVLRLRAVAGRSPAAREPLGQGSRALPQTKLRHLPHVRAVAEH